MKPVLPQPHTSLLTFASTQGTVIGAGLVCVCMFVCVCVSLGLAIDILSSRQLSWLYFVPEVQ